ncbi:MAG: hypothetical protein HZA36_03665 [Parcubacteria group bacterium]|nr:hypothetical protein [Parcubacteria group bacterium]
MNKTLLIVLSIAIAGGLTFLYVSMSKQNIFTPTQPIIGGPDGSPEGHGCIPGAGYSWCEVKKKCLRPWEEACK